LLSKQVAQTVKNVGGKLQTDKTDFDPNAFLQLFAYRG